MSKERDVNQVLRNIEALFKTGSKRNRSPVEMDMSNGSIFGGVSSVTHGPVIANVNPYGLSRKDEEGMNNDYYREVVSKRDRSAERSLSGSRIAGSHRPKSSYR